MKTCNRCKFDKPLFEFGTDNSKKDKKNIYCKICVRQKKNEYTITDRLKEEPVQKDYWYRSNYGISLKEFNILKDSQKNKCKICLTDFDGIECFVDHNHQTGAVRGLLCRGCNSGLGFFKDNPESLLNAIKYLGTLS